MKFVIDNFYLDDNYGVVKYKGSKDGNLLFDKFDKSFVTDGPYSGWLPSGQRVNIKEEFMVRRAAKGKVRQIPPPQ